METSTLKTLNHSYGKEGDICALAKQTKTKVPTTLSLKATCYKQLKDAKKIQNKNKNKTMQLQGCDANNKQENNGVVWIYKMKSKIEGRFVNKQQDVGIVWIYRIASKNEGKVPNKQQDNGVVQICSMKNKNESEALSKQQDDGATQMCKITNKNEARGVNE